jgi:GEVED domain/Putative metal-binding motif/Secretion system C-terminal sorting domain
MNSNYSLFKNRFTSVFTTCKSSSSGLFRPIFLLLLMVGLWTNNVNAQVLTPFTGSNSIACGVNTTLCTHGGCGSAYANNANGFTVINAAATAVVSISGSYTTEASFDFITIFSGSGTGGAVVFGPVSGSGTINFTGTVGQTYTVRFTSDSSVTTTGYNLAVSYTGSCGAPPATLTPFTGSNSIACGVNTTLCTHAGCGVTYANNANGFTVVNAASTAVVNINGSYNTESGFDFIRIYSGSGTGGAVVFGPVSGSGTINFTGTPGQTYTVGFTTDSSVTSTGYNLAVTYTGSCAASAVLTPATGSNSIACGTTTNLCTHAGCGLNYANGVDGHTIINAANSAVLNISGTYATETGWDFITIYSGSGIGGPAVFGPVSGSGTINFTGTPGQTYTIRFTSDGSITSTGYSLAVSYTGSCLPPNVLIPFSGSNSIACGTNATLCSHAGCGNTYANNANGFTVLESTGTTTVNVSGTYSTEACCDSVTIYDGSGIGGAVVFGPVGGSGTINYTGLPGQTLTVRFVSDVSIVSTGLNLTVTYTGDCIASSPPNCAELPIAPADTATNVPSGNVVLSWNAPSSGTAPTGYKVFTGTTPGSLTLATTTANLNATVNFPAYTTTYYWQVVPTAGGVDAVGCAEYSFTTEANPFLPYCSGMTFTSAVEPISSVNFAGINNQSPAALNGGPAHENFIAITGAVTAGSSYPMVLKGNTDGNFTNNFRVFIDWNQDGDFGDAGETYNAGTIFASTGLDAVQASSTIAVPANATAGTTRMRIKKLFGLTNVDNPCLGGGFGQFEDYSLTVSLTWYADTDNDGFGDPASSIVAVTNPGGYVLNNTDCNDNNAAVNPGATEVCYDGLDNNCDGTIDEGCTPIVSVVQPSQCGVTLATINQNIFANLVAGAQGYRFTVTDMTTMQVQSIDKALRVFQLTQLGTYAFARTYQVEVSIRFNNVWQPFVGAACLVTTPSAVTQVQAAQCDGQLTTMGDAIYADNVPFGTGYRFRITNLLTSSSVEVDRLTRDVRLNNIPTFTPEYNTTYSIEIAVKNTNGTYLPYNPVVCNITTPSFPTTQLQLSQCDVTISNPNTTIYADSFVGATTYRFRFVDGAFTYTFDRPLRSFILSSIPVPAGATYSVQVSIEINGVFGPYGKICTLTIPGGARGNDAVAGNNFQAIASPNPFASTFGLNLSTTSEEMVQVRVYDMLGKLIEDRKAQVSDIIELGENYPSGVYNVIVSQGENIKTLRVIKR